MVCFSLSSILLVAAIFASTDARCLNEVAQYNYQSRTLTQNNTYFLVPVKKTAVEAALKEAFPSLFSLLGIRNLKLLKFPASLGIPEGMHPVVVSAGLSDDIRQMDLKIDGQYMSATIGIPYVGKGSSSTPLFAPVTSYLSGTGPESNNYLSVLIPNLVATIGGITTRTGRFIPTNAAYQRNDDSLGSYGINVQYAPLPNQVTGPGIYPQVGDLKFVTEIAPFIDLATWKSIINQPYMLKGLGGLLTLDGKCQRNTVFFNNSTSTPTFRTGNITFGDAASVLTTTAVLKNAGKNGVGIYENVSGFSACGQVVGYGAVVPTGEDCDDAAAKVRNTPGAL